MNQMTVLKTNIAFLVGFMYRYITTIGLAEILDIAILAFLVYKLLTFMRDTRATSLMKGVLVFVTALWLSSMFGLTGVRYVLNVMMDWGVLALIILFQPEIRRMLEQVLGQVGSHRFSKLFNHGVEETQWEVCIRQTVQASTDMSRSLTGALIVFERELHLDDMARSGTILNADVSSELLKNIFFVKAPMHDGAVIIRDGRVLAAGCMLPLSKNVNLSRDLGMRHRAGIGMSENSDALVVIVSEETGAISVAHGGMLKRHLTAENLENLLRNELLPKEEENAKQGGFLYRFRIRKEDDNDGTQEQGKE